MGQENYAETLKKLLTFTQAKFVSIAEVVGYDISYVNKWSNGTKLPSSRYIEQINEDLGRYFTRLIKENNREKRFIKTFALPEDTTDLEFAITQHLCAAYRASIHQTHPTKTKDGKPSASLQVLTGTHNTKSFLSDLIHKEVSTKSGETELLVFDDFCTLYQAGFWNFFNDLPLQQKSLTVRVGLDLDRLDDDCRLFEHVYATLNRLLDINFIFYDIKDIERSNLLIMKDSFVIQYALSKTGSFMMCSHISDEATVRDIYENFNFSDLTKRPLTALSDSLGMDNTGYRTAFYANSRFFFHLTNGFDFLLPHDVFESIRELSSPEQQQSIQRLCVTWEEIVNNAEIEFIIPTSSLMRYLENGYIYLTDVEYSLTPEERKEHIQTVLSTMQENPHIIMGVLSTLGLGKSYKGENLSFYSNYKTGFMKKNKRYIHNQASPFYLITDRRLHTIVLNYFRSLKELPLYRQYKIDELLTIYERIKPLIERTICIK